VAVTTTALRPEKATTTTRNNTHIDIDEEEKERKKKKKTTRLGCVVCGERLHAGWQGGLPPPVACRDNLSARNTYSHACAQSRRADAMEETAISDMNTYATEYIVCPCTYHTKHKLPTRINGMAGL
jgi:hypothetical protein